MNASEREDFTRLLAGLRDETLAPQELAQLEQLVLRDPEALTRYIEVMSLRAALRWASPPETLAPAAGRWARAWSAFNKHVGQPTPLSLLVAGLFVTGMMLSLALWTLPPWREQPSTPAPKRSHIVAEVVHAHEARWAPASLVDGRPPIDLFVGEPVELLQGTAAIRFDSGAVVLVEGPATFAPQGRQRLLLRDGKLVARVPQRAIGFLVSTPTVSVLDLGTEFSVQAAEHETEVHVLQGSVEVQRVQGDMHARPHLLTAGQAARFGNSSSQGFYVQETEMNRSIFLGMMALLAAAAPAEAAWVSYHDFGANSTAAASTGNITTHQFGTTNTVPLDTNAKALIRYADGEATGVQFSVVGTGNNAVFDGRFDVTAPPAAGTPAAALFDIPGLNLNNGQFSVNNTPPTTGGGTLTFTLTGLDPDKLYDIAFYGHRSGSGAGVEHFTLGGAVSANNISSTGILDAFTTALETQPNAATGHIIRWTDINPGADGIITVLVDPTVTSNANLAYLSAMRLEELAVVPEPSTTALSAIGFLGLIALAMKRRRRR